MKPDELARLRAKAAAAMAVSDDGHWFKAESLDMDPADADYVSALPPGKVVDMIDHIAKLEEALREAREGLLLLCELTPAAANARDARDMQLTVGAIAAVTLDKIGEPR